MKKVTLDLHILFSQAQEDLDKLIKRSHMNNLISPELILMAKTTINLLEDYNNLKSLSSEQITKLLNNLGSINSIMTMNQLDSLVKIINYFNKIK